MLTVAGYDEKGVPNPFEFVLGAHEVIDGSVFLPTFWLAVD